eukprot:1158867-Pelagomonas_calceolata.AAC.24
MLVHPGQPKHVRCPLTWSTEGGNAGEGMHDIHSLKPSSVLDSDRASHWRSKVDIQLGARWQFWGCQGSRNCVGRGDTGIN